MNNYNVCPFAYNAYSSREKAELLPLLPLRLLLSKMHIGTKHFPFMTQMNGAPDNVSKALINAASRTDEPNSSRVGVGGGRGSFTRPIGLTCCPGGDDSIGLVVGSATSCLVLGLNCTTFERLLRSKLLLTIASALTRRAESRAENNVPPAPFNAQLLVPGCVFWARTLRTNPRSLSVNLPVLLPWLPRGPLGGLGAGT